MNIRGKPNILPAPRFIPLAVVFYVAANSCPGCIRRDCFARRTAAGNAQDHQKDHQQEKNCGKKQEPPPTPVRKLLYLFPYVIEEKQYLIQNRFQDIHTCILYNLLDKRATIRRKMLYIVLFSVTSDQSSGIVLSPTGDSRSSGSSSSGCSSDSNSGSTISSEGSAES